MADNTIISLQSGGDAIRDIDRAGIKTQVLQLDIGGAASEALVVAGQKTMAASLPVVLASDQNSLTIASVANGTVSTVNSSAVPLAANAVFTGPAEDVTEFSDGRVTVFSDQPSATDGLQMQQSANGTNWDIADLYSIPAATGKIFSVGMSTKFFRIVYTNGATAQTSFRLQTKYHKGYGRGSSVRPQDGRSNDNDMEEELAHLMGYNGVGWDRLRTTVANGLAVDVTRMPATVVSTANASAVTVLQNAVAVTGNGTSLSVAGYGTTVLQISGTFVASIAFETSVDAGVSWNPISATVVGQGEISNTATAPGIYRMTTAGMDLVRARVTWTSGTSITINGKSSNAVNASKIVKLASGNLIAGKFGIDQTTPGVTNLVTVVGASLPSVSTSIAAAGTGTIGPLAVNTAGNVTFTVKNTVAASAYAGTPVFVFEQSDDNVNWGPLIVARADTSAAASTFTLSANTANAELMFDAGLEGVAWVRCRVTTGPTTNALSVNITQGGMPFTPYVSVLPQPITKGNQGVAGFTTQDLKDAGRVNVAISCYRAAGVPTTEALFAAATFSNSRDGAAPSTGVQFSVTAGKRLRVQSIEVSIFNNAAAACTAKLVLRYAAAGGTITITSPILAIWDIGSNSVTAGNYIGPTTLPLPDGAELLPASTYGFTSLASAATVLHTISLNGYEY